MNSVSFAMLLCHIVIGSALGNSQSLSSNDVQCQTFSVGDPYAVVLERCSVGMTISNLSQKTDPQTSEVVYSFKCCPESTLREEMAEERAVDFNENMSDGFVAKADQNFSEGELLETSTVLFSTEYVTPFEINISNPDDDRERDEPQEETNFDVEIDGRGNVLEEDNITDKTPDVEFSNSGNDKTEGPEETKGYSSFYLVLGLSCGGFLILSTIAVVVVVRCQRQCLSLKYKETLRHLYVQNAAYSPLKAKKTKRIPLDPQADLDDAKSSEQLDV